MDSLRLTEGSNRCRSPLPIGWVPRCPERCEPVGAASWPARLEVLQRDLPSSRSGRSRPIIRRSAVMVHFRLSDRRPFSPEKVHEAGKLTQLWHKRLLEESCTLEKSLESSNLF